MIDPIQRIRNAKKKIRQEMISLPFEEKIRRVVEMQKFSRDFKKAKGARVYVWRLDVLPDRPATGK